MRTPQAFPWARPGDNLLVVKREDVDRPGPVEVEAMKVRREATSGKRVDAGDLSCHVREVLDHSVDSVELAQLKSGRPTKNRSPARETVLTKS